MKRKTIQHRKMLALYRILGVRHAEAVGLMEMLWQWTAEMCPTGAIGAYTDVDIAAASGWEGDPSAFVEALKSPQVRFVESHKGYRLVVHDWSQHCEDSVHKRLEYNKERFWDGSKPHQKHRLRRKSISKQSLENVESVSGESQPCLKPLAFSLKPLAEAFKKEEPRAVVVQEPTRPTAAETDRESIHPEASENGKDNNAAARHLAVEVAMLLHYQPTDTRMLADQQVKRNLASILKISKEVLARDPNAGGLLIDKAHEIGKDKTVRNRLAVLVGWWNNVKARG